MISLSFTPSTALTLIRLIGGTALMPILLWNGLPQRRKEINIMLATVFGLFGITDFLDGYLARRFSQETELGRILDPIADKALVFSTLISLVMGGRVPIVVAAIIIGREIFILALRESARRHTTPLPVGWTGKVKTSFQFGYLSIVMLNNGDRLAPFFSIIETFLLVGTIFFTAYSAILYYQTYLELSSPA